MSKGEIKEFCRRVIDYKIKVKVRLKSHLEPLVGKIEGTTNTYFLLNIEAQETPVEVSFVNVANITV